MKKQSIRILQLDRSVQELAKCSFSQLSNRMANMDDSSLLKIAPALTDILLEEFPEIQGIIRELNSDPHLFAIAIHGLPVDSSNVSTPVGRCLSIALATIHGSPFQYSTQNRGGLIGRIEVVPGLEDAPDTGEGNGRFGLHSDDAAFAGDCRCQQIQLIGVQNESNVPTILAPLPDVLERLSSSTIRILCESRFIFRVPVSMRIPLGIWTQPKPVLCGLPAAPRIQFASYSTTPANPNDHEAACALTELTIASENSLSEIVAGPGSALIFFNDRGLHGRPAFTGKRLVLRTYIRNNLDTMRAICGHDGNVFDTVRVLIEGHRMEAAAVSTVAA